MVLPVPAHDPRAGRRRAALRRPRPGRASAAPTSRPSGPTTPTPATSSGCARPCSTSSTCATSRWSARTGAAWSACALAAENPDRFARIVVANTGLPTGDRTPTDAFLAWQRFSQEAEDFPVGGIVNGGCTTELSPEVIAAYDAPFPDDTYKAGARIFPTLVPTSPDDPAADANRAAWEVLGAVGQAAAHRLLRQRPDHPRRGAPVPEARARRPGPPARHHRGRRPLPPGGQGPGAGARWSSTSSTRRPPGRRGIVARRCQRRSARFGPRRRVTRGGGRSPSVSARNGSTAGACAARRTRDSRPS